MDPSDFKQIFLPCHAKMYAAAWRLTGNQQEAEDLVQDALMRLWTKRKDLNFPDNAAAFAVTTLRNLYYDQHRKKHLQINDEEPEERQAQSTDDVSTDLEHRQHADIVGKAIATLPDTQRLIITLHDIDDLSYEEIEAQTGLNSVNARVALSRARKAVREKIKRII